MDQVEKFAVVILGPQGSGKGTQAQILSEKLGLERFEMGAQLRAVKQRNDDFSKQVSDIIDRGAYVDDWMIERVLREYFAEKNPSRIIFDGVPRTLNQSNIFDTIIEELQFPKPLVINVNLSKKTSLKRLLPRGRQDDTPEIIEQRLKNHYELTGPVIEKYREQNRVIDIDGEPAIEQVTKIIFETLAEKGIK